MGGKNYNKIWQGTLFGGAMGFMASEQFGNWTKGKGFVNNDQVLKNFESGNYDITGFETWQDAALDHFGFKGQYDPENKAFKINPDAPAATDPKTGEIFYNIPAFEEGHDKVMSAYLHELKHKSDILSGNYIPGKKYSLDLSEHNAYKYTYRNQGLYPKYNKSNSWISSINQSGNAAFIPKYIYNDYIFQRKWWHRIYEIRNNPILW